jgi:hypothetical protein
MSSTSFGTSTPPWKRDRDTLKQAEIEEGQWNEKRRLSSAVGISEIRRRLNAGRDRCAAEKRAAEEKAGREAAISTKE